MASLTHQLLHRSRLGAWLRLMRFDRPIGTLLLLWPTLWALWFAADGVPRPGVLTIFVLGVIVMRAAGCVINDYADRHIDPYVERTAERPLARGEIAPRSALLLFFALLLIAFGLVCFTNTLTILLALAGAFLAATYPFLKRYTYLPQFYLGIAFAWAVPMAYAAQAGAVEGMTWLLFTATVLWTTAYDTFYAMVDRDDDVKIGVRSTAILFGELDRIAIGIAQLCFLGALALAGVRAGYGAAYFAGVAVAAALCGWQQWLARSRAREDAFRAFLNNNWVGLAVFLGLVLETWPR